MLIKVKVFANCGKENIKQKSPNSFEITVKEKPVLGMANKRVLEIIANYFQIPVSKAHFVRGATQPNKIIEII